MIFLLGLLAVAGLGLIGRAGALWMGLAQLPSGLPAWGAAGAEAMVGGLAMFTALLAVCAGRAEEEGETRRRYIIAYACGGTREANLLPSDLERIRREDSCPACDGEYPVAEVKEL